MALFSKNKEENGSKFKYTNTSFPLSYDIKLTTNLTINNVTYNETNTEIEWKINKWEANKDGYEVSIFSEKHNIVKFPAHVKSLVEFLIKFNIPLSNLELQLNHQGLPISILNQKEILDKWLYFKNNDLVRYDEDDTLKSVISGGDSDFSKSLSVINHSLIYILFLSPVFGDKKMNTPKIHTFTQRSQLFSNDEIKINLNEKIISESNLDIKLEHKGYGELKDYGKAEKIFKESYKQISNSSFNYDYKMNVQYEYDRNGILIKCIAEIIEQANELVSAKETYIIKLIQ